MGRGSVGGGEDQETRQLDKRPDGHAETHPRRQGETQRQRREGGAGGRGVGERETAREDALRRSQETGVGGAGPPTKGKARPPPNPCPRTRRGHARARTHATPPAPPGPPPSEGRACRPLPTRTPPPTGPPGPVPATHLGPRATSAAAATAQSRSPGPGEGASEAPPRPAPRARVGRPTRPEPPDSWAAADARQVATWVAGTPTHRGPAEQAAGGRGRPPGIPPPGCTAQAVGGARRGRGCPRPPWRPRSALRPVSIPPRPSNAHGAPLPQAPACGGRR